jgi:anti-repressor protein
VSALELFQSDAWSVRAELRDGEPWFVAADVCKALGIANSRDAVARLSPDGVGTADVIDSMGRTQRASVINEPQLYRLIFQSRRPEAEAFTDWVTRDVLPAIRRTGTYTAPAAMPSHAEALRGWAHELERSEQLAAEVAVLAPKAAIADDLIDAEGTHDIAAAAQILSSIPGVTIGAKKLRDYLRAIGWITKDLTAPRAMQAQIITGRLVMKEDQWTDADGVPHLRHQIRVTGKGLAELHRLLATSPQLTLVMGGA